MNKTGSKILHGMLLATSAMVGSTVIVSTAAMANPAGGSVAVGSATITNPSATQTVINQSSKKALINWNSFNIATGSSVTFNQPNAKSLTVNRVTGPGSSTIDGSLFANGNIWLLNANGILFGKGSQINVGSLLATTSELSDADFKAGNNNFTASPNPNASVINQGTINVSRGGSVVLSAPMVSNEGLIQADLGTVVLGGAQAFTVDMTGDNLLRYQISAPVAQTPKDSNGNAASALVSNSGTISAAGGHVVMTARAAKNVEDSVINNSGMVEATSVSVHNGEVDIDAGDGTANIGGTVNVSGNGTGQTGGTVTATGDTVNVADGAIINASGSAGGGTVLIGGGPHGTGTLAHAQRTIIGAATITADATVKGDGGNVTVWSDGTTTFNGAISARGGAQGGNGGQVETSGHNLGVSAAAKVDTSAPLGLTGDWLLDPDTIIIQSGGNTTTDGNGTLALGTDMCQTDTIDPSTIIAQLANTTVTLEAKTEIEVCSTLAYNSTNALSLLSEGGILVAQSIQNNGTGGIYLVAGWDGSTTNSAQFTTSGVYGAGTGQIQVYNGASVGSKGGNTTLAGGAIDIGIGFSGTEQIGYNGAGTGDIRIVSNNTIVLNGGNGTVVIGNGVQNSCVTGPVGGNISITTLGSASNLTLTPGSGQVDIGNGQFGGGGVSGPVSGDIAINVGGALQVGCGTVAIGNNSGTTSGNVSVIANSLSESGTALESDLITDLGYGNVLFGDGSDYNFSGVNATYSSAHDFSLLSKGNVTVSTSIQNSGSGKVNVVAGWDGATTNFAAPLSTSAYGNSNGSVTLGGFVSIGSASGATTVAGYDVTANASAGLTQIGYHGNGGGDIFVDAKHNVVLAGDPASDPFDIAQIGNDGATGSNDQTGNITVVAGNDVTLTGGGASSYAQIGNGGNHNSTTTSGNVSGNISITATGNVSLTGGSGGFALIGNGAEGSNEINSGDITVIAHDVTVLGGNSEFAQIGNGGFDGQGGSGNITVNATGNVSLTADPSSIFGYALIGNGGTTSDGGSGDILVKACGTLKLTAGETYAQIGNGGYNAFADNTGNVTVNITGTVTLNGTGADSNQDANGYAEIGSGGRNLTGTNNGSVSLTAGNLSLVTANNATYFIGNQGGDTNDGNINVAVAGLTTIDASNGTVTIGNTGGSENSGNVTFITGNLSETGTAFESDFLTDLSGGNVLFGDGSDYEYNAGNANVSTSNNLSLLSKGNLTIDNSIQNASNGSITLVAGWDGNATTFSAGTPLAWNHGGNITIGGTDACGSVAVGSANGATNVFGGNITLDAENGSAQIGYTGGANGAINVHGAGALTLQGGENYGEYAQIGHGSANASASEQGDITVTAASVNLTAGYNQTADAQIGHGGIYANGSLSGNISVTATTGNITLLGNGDGYALIGHGGGYAGSSEVVPSYSGDITVITSNGAIALTGSNATGAQGGFAEIGDAGLASDTGTITVNSKANLKLTGGASNGADSNSGIGNAWAQIGSSGGGTNQDINVTVGGNLTLIGGTGEAYNDNSVASDGAQIGNGGVGNLIFTNPGGDTKGNITVNVTGATTIVSSVQANDAWIGNIPPSGSNGTGTTTILTGTLDTSGDGLGDFGNSIAHDLSNGDVFVGVTNASVEADFGGIEANASHNLTIAAAGDLTADGNITNSGNGSIALIGGWDGTTTDFNGLAFNATSYGVPSGEAVLINNGFSVGSAGGTTLVAGYDITVSDGQIGYNDTNGVSGTGNITVFANGGSGYVVLYGSADHGGQIGHGGLNSNGTNSGDITVETASTGYVQLHSQTGFTQIGHGGAGSNANASETNSGNITITTGIVQLFTGNASGAYAQIGHGGLDSNTGLNDGNSGNITVTALTGDIQLSPADNSTNNNAYNIYAQIGSGGAGSGNTDLANDGVGYTTDTGDINVTSVNGSVVLDGSPDSTIQTGYAVIGETGTAIKTGNITVSAGQDITLTGGNATNNGIGNAFALIGDANQGNITADINVTAGGNLTLTGGTGTGGGAGDYAQIGNNDNSGDTVTGNITVNVTGFTNLSSSLAGDGVYLGNTDTNNGDTVSGDISLTSAGGVNLSATGDGAIATIGNLGGNGTSESGNITVNTTNASLSLSSNGAGAYAQIGNWSDADTSGTSSGDITINAGAISLTATGDGFASVAEIGNGDFNGFTQTGEVSGDISVNGTSVVLNATTVSSNDYDVARIGNLGKGQVVGNLTVTTSTGDVTLTANATAGGSAVADIGDYSNPLDESFKTLQGEASANTTVNAGGNVTVTASGGGGYGAIEVGGATDGTVTVNATGNISETASGGAGALIGGLVFGNGTVDVNLTSATGSINVSATGNGSAQVGTFESLPTSEDDSPYTVGGNITLIASDTTNGTITVSTDGSATATAVVGVVGANGTDNNENGTTATGVVNLTAGNAISLGNGSEIAGPSVALNAQNDITQTANTSAVVAAYADVTSASGNITLTSGANQIDSTDLSASGYVSLYDSDNLDVYSASAGGNLALLATGNLTFSGSAESSNGTVLAVAGWDGNATTPAQFDAANATSYGNSNGSVIVGGESASGNVTVGGLLGTSVYGYDVSVLGYQGNAQLGYASGSGNIIVKALNDISVAGSMLTGESGECWSCCGTSTPLSASIGNGSPYNSDAVGGNITLNAGHDVSVSSGEGGSALIGNQGTGTVNGTINITAGGNISVTASTGSSGECGEGCFGKVTVGSATIGNGNFNTSGDVGGNITLGAGHDVLVAGEGGTARIGNQGAGAVSGDINITATAGNISVTAYTGECGESCFGNITSGSATIGNGSPNAAGIVGGNITLNAGNDVLLSGESGYVLVGNQGAGSAVNGTINITAAGNVSLFADGEGGAQIGNSGYGEGVVVGGDINVTANGTGGVNLNTTGGGEYAQIGNYGSGEGAQVGGNITVIANNGSIILSASADYGLTQIGNEGYGSTDPDVSGDIVVQANGGNITLNATGQNATVQIGNSSAHDDGTIGGNITVNASSDISLLAQAEGSLAQIGNGGIDHDGDISGNIIVNAGGNITLNATASAEGEEGGEFFVPPSYAVIGNGDITGSSTGNVSGNINITAGGKLKFTANTDLDNEEDGDDDVTWIGNLGGSGEGNIESGNLTVVAKSIDDSNGTSFGSMIAADLGSSNMTGSGGDVFVGVSDSPTIGGFSYDSPHTLSIASKANLIVNRTLENYGTGAINLVGGWDGTTFTPTSLGNTDVFGNNNGSVTIGDGSHDASIGSANGTTSVFAYNVTVDGSDNDAQLGFHGPASGNIVVTALHDISVVSDLGSAQIGNGEKYFPVAGNVGGNITLSAGHDVLLQANGASSTIGNTGAGTSINGTINITAAGNVSLMAQGEGDAQIGNLDFANASQPSVLGGDIFVTANGSGGISLIAQNGTGDGALIGNSGSNSNVGGNITIRANGGNLTLHALGYESVVLIGNDGLSGANGTIGGNIQTYAAHDTSLLAHGDESIVQIGNSGVLFGTPGGLISGTINVTTGGNLTIVADADAPNGYGSAMIGNGGVLALSSGNVSGDIWINGNVVQVVANGPHDLAAIGDVGLAGNQTTIAESGNITVNATTSLTVSALAANSLAQIGNQEYSFYSSPTYGDASGNINVTAGSISLNATNGSSAAVIGNGNPLGYNGNVSGNVTVTTNGTLTMSATGVAGANATSDTTSLALIGQFGRNSANGTVTVNATGNIKLSAGDAGNTIIGGASTAGNTSGAVKVTSCGTITANATGTRGHDLIGHTGVNANGDVNVTSTGDVTLNASGAQASTEIGDFGSGVFAGNITVDSTTGNVSAIASGVSSFTAIGLDAFGNGASASGNVNVTGANISATASNLGAITDIGGGASAGAGANITLTVNATNVAVTASANNTISDIGLWVSGNSSQAHGDVSVTASQNVNVTASGNGSLAQIGNGGANASNTVGGNVTVHAGGNITLTANGTPSVAEIGNVGGGTLGGNINVTANGALSISALKAQSVAQIGNAEIGVTDPGVYGDASGNINVTAGSISLNATNGSSAAVIGNGNTQDYNANVTGNVTVTTNGTLTMSATGVAGANATSDSTSLALIGAYGRNSANGTVTVNATGNIGLSAGDAGTVVIGAASNTGNMNATVNVASGAAINLNATGTRSHILIGNGGLTAGGNVNVTATGDISLVASGSNASAEIMDFSDSGTAAGNVTVISTGGNVSVGADGSTSFAGIGLMADGTNANITGNVTVQGLIVSAESSGANAISNIGLVADGTGANATGAVSVTGSQGVSVTANGSGALANIGMIADFGSANGNVTIQTPGNLTFSAGTGGLADIGLITEDNGSANGTANITANLVNVVQGSAEVSGTTANIVTTGAGVGIAESNHPLIANVKNLSVLTSNGSAYFTAPGAITLTGINVGSGTFVMAANGTVNQTAAINAFAANVSATNGSIVLTNANNTITDASLITTGDATLTDSTGLTITGATVTGNLTLTAPSVGQTGAIAAKTIVVTATGGDIVLTNTGNVITNASLTAAGNASLTDSTDLTITGASAAGGNLTLVAASIGQSGGINVTNLFATSANTDITLTGNNAITDASLNATGNASLTVNGGLIITGATAGGNLTLNATSIGQSGAIHAGGLNANASNGSIALNNTGNVFARASLTTPDDASLTDSTGVIITGASVGGNLTLNATSIGESGAIHAPNLIATATNGSIALNAAGNVIADALLTAPGDVSLTDTANLTVVGASAGGNMTLTAASIGQTGVVTAAALTATATGGDIVLNNAANSFANASLSATGNASVTDSVGVTLTGGSVGGTLTVNSTSIGESGSGVAAHTLIANASNGSIALVSTGNSIANASLTATGDASLTDSTDLNILGVSAGGGDVTLDASSISQTGAINAVTLVATASNGSIALDNAGNTVQDASLTASGDAALTVVGGLTVTDASVGGTLALHATSVAQTGAIDAKILAVTASSGDIVLNNASNSFTDASLTASGNVSLTDATDLTITGASAGGGDLTVDATSIAQTGAINATNLVATASNGSIALNNAGNTVTNASLTASGDASLADANGLTITDASVGGELSLTAASIGQTGAIDAAKTSATASNGSITLDNASNVIADASLDASGNVSLYDNSSLTLDPTAGGDFTVLATGDLDFISSVQLTGGSLLAVAGWDGHTTGAAAATGSAYGNNGKSITIGGADAVGGVAVGSKTGTTTLAGDDLLLSAVNGYAQVGYHGGGSGAIRVNATGDVTLNGGANTAYFAQIGDGGYQVTGSNSGAVTVLANGNISLNAGAGQEAYAQIGNGGAESNSNTSGYTNTGDITVGGAAISMTAGSGNASYVQIGDGGYKSGQSLNGTATVGGAIAVNAVSVVTLHGGAADAYAQIGNGGDFINNGAASGSGGTINGPISVAVSNPATPGNAVILTAGSGANAYAQIGDGGNGENTPASGSVNFSVGGNITIADLALTASSTGTNGYAQIGNGSENGYANVSGDIVIDPGAIFYMTPGTPSGAITIIHNNTGVGTVTGTITGFSSTTPVTDPTTVGSISTTIQNNNTPTDYIYTAVFIQPQLGTSLGQITGSDTNEPTPLEKLAGNDDGIPSDDVAHSVSDSLNGGKTYVTTRTLIPGVLEEIVTLTPRNPHGIPPADEDYSSWGNEALWRW